LERYRDEGHTTGLLYTIARNALIDGHRKQGRNSHLYDEPEHSQPNPEAHLLVREEYRRVLAALKELEPDERDALSLVVSSDLSYREIARISGTSEANIKVRVHRARIKLRKMMRTGEK
jgi:RNA polymerase sigma-70 factor (ECF subfamily)